MGRYFQQRFASWVKSGKYRHFCNSKFTVLFGVVVDGYGIIFRRGSSMKLSFTMNCVARGLLSGDSSFFECCYQWLRLCCSGWRGHLLVHQGYRKYQYTSQFWSDIPNSQASTSSIVVAGTSIATRCQRETHEKSRGEIDR